MEYVWIILRRDLRSLLTPGGKRSLKSRLAIILGVVFYALFAVGVGYGAYRLFAYLATSLAFLPGFKAAIEINLLNGTCLAVLVMVLLTGIQTTYKTIYESDDIGFLMAQPVPVRSIFAAKYVTAYVTLLALAGAFGLPAWTGYGIARGAGAGFYILATVALGLLLLLAHSVVSFMLLVAMRYLPGRKMKQLFIASTAILGILVVLLSQMLSARLQNTQDPLQMLETLGKGQLAKTWYLPSTWAVNLVLGTIPEYGLNPVPSAIALFAVAIGLSWMSISVSGKWFMVGWAGRTEETDAGSGSRRKARGRGAGAAREGPAPGGAYWTVLRKDLRLLFRDPLVWYNLAIGVIVVGFFLFNMRRTLASGTSGTDDAASMVGGAVLMMAVMMGSVTGAQTGGISLSREGPSFWLVRSSPIGAKELLAAKMTYALLPPAALFLLSLAGVELASVPHFPLWESALLGTSMVVSVASLQILLDVLFPDFTMKVEFGSSKSGRGTGKLLTTMFASMATVFLLFFLITLPATGLSGKLFPGMAEKTVASVVRAFIVLIAVVLATSAGYFGVRRTARILTDM